MSHCGLIDRFYVRSELFYIFIYVFNLFLTLLNKLLLPLSFYQGPVHFDRVKGTGIGWQKEEFNVKMGLKSLLYSNTMVDGQVIKDKCGFSTANLSLEDFEKFFEFYSCV
jgi:hypothetical protein